MRAINNIPKEEYAELLSEAMRRMSKKIYRLMDEEDSLSTKADNQGDEEKACGKRIRMCSCMILNL